VTNSFLKKIKSLDSNYLNCKIYEKIVINCKLFVVQQRLFVRLLVYIEPVKKEMIWITEGLKRAAAENAQRLGAQAPTPANAAQPSSQVVTKSSVG
jgi:hypothetical protein